MKKKFIILSIILISCQNNNTSNKNIDIIYYDSGEKKEQGELFEGEKEGKWTSWYKNGAIKSQGYFKDGLMNGIHQHWSEDGILLKKYIYKNNEMDGLQQEWFTDGKPGAQWDYKNGEMHGRHVEWYHNGFKKLQGTRNKNSMEGTWTYWYENGQKRGVRTILNKKLEGLTYEWYSNGNLRTKGMFNQGWINEVENLLELQANQKKTFSSLNSIGYKHVKRFLNNEISEEEMFEIIYIRTRQLARRQEKWFKKEPINLFVMMDSLMDDKIHKILDCFVKRIS